MPHDYALLQWIQIGASAVMLLVGRAFLKINSRTLTEAPFLPVVSGYIAASAMSNLIRYRTDDITALRGITEKEYSEATSWWLCSAALFLFVYLLIVSLLGARPSRGADRVMNLLKGMRSRYIFVVIVLLVSYFLNPFRLRDYGVLTATTSADLQVGGLLISGFLTQLIAAVSLPIALARLWSGLPFLAISVAILLATGSKAIAAVYVVVCGFKAHTTERSSTRFSGLKRKIRSWFVLAILGACAGLLVVVSVSKRFNSSDVSLKSAMSASVVRFTQQDVASMIYARSEWRSELSRRYVRDTLYSFVPGFIWPGKPHNPAYEINALWGQNFTAASPSLFGALFLACNGAWYWSLLMFSGLSLGLIDGVTLRAQGIELSSHLHWLSIFNTAMLFEANFVIWFVQLIVLVAWRLWLVQRMRRQQFKSVGC